MHRAPIEPARSARSNVRPRVGWSRWCSPLARRNSRRKGPAFLGWKKSLAARGQTTRDNFHSLIGPYRSPCDVSEEGNAMCGGAGTPNAEGRWHLAHHLCRRTRSRSAPTAGSRARFSPDLTRWPAQVVRAPGLEPIFWGRGALHSTESSHLDMMAQAIFATIALL